jgi:cytochrome c peroxidase
LPVFLASCSNSSDTADYVTIDPSKYQTFSGKIDLNKLQNYANQTVPTYITKDNTVGMLSLIKAQH